MSGFVHDGNTTTVCVLTDIHNALSHKEVDAWINLTRAVSYTHLDVYKRQAQSIFLTSCRADSSREWLLHGLW